MDLSCGETVEEQTGRVKKFFCRCHVFAVQVDNVMSLEEKDYFNL